jgi:hypothetical protein
MYPSPSSDIIRVINTRKMGWARYVAHMREVKNTQKLDGKREGKRLLGSNRSRLGIILKRNLKT